jgi:hypothetical protein
MVKFTVDYLKNLFQHNIMWQDAKKNLDFLDSYAEKDPKAIEEFLSTMEQAYDKVVQLIGNVHFKEKDLLGRLLEWNDIPSNIHDFFPVPVYISSGSSDGDSIGIMLFEDGKKELFEGNTEASDETYKIVNELLGVADKWVKIYAQHGVRIIRLIERTQKIPEGIYVSPRRDVAEGYWHITEEKYLFSCEIQEKYVRKESDIDWKIIEDCKMRNFKIL